MIEILPQSEGRYMALKYEGKISDADYQNFMPEVDRWMEEHAGRFRVLLDWGQLEGWDETAAENAFLIRVSHQGDCERIAVTGDSGWSGEVERMAELAEVGEYRLFPSQALDDAWEWLRRPVT